MKKTTISTRSVIAVTMIVLERRRLSPVLPARSGKVPEDKNVEIETNHTAGGNA